MMLTRQQPTTKWIRVAGLGRFDLPREVYWSSLEIGRAIACEGYGLVVGGWHGVDYVAADAFYQELQKLQKPLLSYLIQVVPYEKSPEFHKGDGGYVIQIKQGEDRYVESVRYCDAVVLLGGEGGTFDLYRHAVQEQKAVFPVAGTGGDARRAFEDVLTNWDQRPTQLIQQELFREVLGREIRSAGDAEQITQGLMQLIKLYLRAQAESLRTEAKVIFISYSHQDRAWLEKLRTHLRPLERQGNIKIWDDSAIEAGKKWEQEIQAALNSARVAVFLVSPSFIASDFIVKNEIPPLLEAADRNRVKVLWIHVSASSYDEIALDPIQAAHDIAQPLDSLTPAQQNEVFVKIYKEIKKAILDS